MTLKLLQSAILVPVPAVTMLTEEGEFTVEFSLLFKRISEKERKRRLRTAMKSLKLGSRFNKALTDEDVPDDELDDIQSQLDKLDANSTDLLLSDIVGWRDLTDLDGGIVPYSEEIKADLLSVVPIRDAILTVWSRASGALDKSVEEGVISKN